MKQKGIVTFEKHTNMKVYKLFGWIVIQALLFTACGTDKGADAAARADTSAVKVYPARVTKVQKQSITKTIDYTANLVAFKEIHFAPSSPGRINKIHVEVGDRVTKGQVLVEMDKTQLNQAATQYENAKINFRRIDTLHRLKSISEQQYDQVKAQYEVAKSSYEYLMENTNLLSPVNGMVTAKYFENGELYSGAPNTLAGKAAIVTLMQINPLKAVVSISQSYFSDVKQGMEASITTDIIPGKVFKASVYKVYPTIDAATRTFKTEIMVKNASEILRPGMFGNIKIKLKDTEALVVPSIAVLKQEGTNHRYVFVNDKGSARQVIVKIGKRFDDQLEIAADGLKEGDELIVDGQANLLNGSKIKLVTK